MQPGYKDERVWAVAVSLLLPLLTALYGDPLYLGTRYYLLVAGVAIGLSMLIKAPRMFTLGAALAVAATLAGYGLWALSLTRPEGLLGLGHLLSLPGAAVGLVGGALFARRRRSAAVAAFAAGLLFVLLGFGANQMVVCNTLMWCGPLSAPIHG
ncbi:hypothetical protein [Lysobacter sp. CA199]|uniref:hypothetical protein n=1 Tax=Lysobacter sp. CA199 TaxID=3455608 RepID=UPI003F8D1663